MAGDTRYLINLFTEETWRESRQNAGFAFTGHTPNLNNRQSIKPGDLFLCWVTRVSACVGVMEVTGNSYEVPHEDPPTWRRGLYPLRYPARLLTRAPLTEGVTLSEVREHAQDPSRWQWILRKSGTEIPIEDARWIVARLQSRTQLAADAEEPQVADESNGAAERPHLRLQAKLLRLGRAMGLDTYVARNDRTLIYEGTRLEDMASVDTLPVGLPDAVRRTVELVDVIWFRRNEYVGMFEVEATTDIFKGLLRMADLIALLPNLVVLMFIVAPEERRGAVFEQITRPVFANGLQRPLEQSCRFIAFEPLEADYDHQGERIGAFDPVRYLETISESAPEAS